MSITEFLLARIAEDEDAAREWYGTGTVANRRDDFWLAECAAKRRIVELHSIYRGPRLLSVDSSASDYACELCHATSSIDSKSVIEALGPCDTLLALASVYADHPDFREEWRTQ